MAQTLKFIQKEEIKKQQSKDCILTQENILEIQRMAEL